MTSEIRANTLKNRVGLGTVSFTNTGPVVSGIITATGADINGDLDVDGHTNLDNLSVAGVSTFTGNADFSSGVDVTGTITGNNLTLSDNDPELTFIDLNNNPDYRIKAESGNLSFEDTTNGNVARLKINANGKINVTGRLDVADKLTVGHTNPSAKFTVGPTNGSTNIEIEDYGVIRGYDRNSGAWSKIEFEALNYIFDTSGSERLRLDSGGRVLINRTNNDAPGGSASKLQIRDTTYTASIAVVRNDPGGGGPSLVFGKSRNATQSDNTLVQNGDILGQISFFGADGSDMNSTGAMITAQVDGTPGSNDMPGRLVFKTTADGSASSTERLRIDSSGRVIIGDTNTNNAFSGGDSLVIGNTPSGTRSGITLVSNSSTDGGIYFSTGSSNQTMGQVVYNHPDNSLRFYANNNQRLRIKSDGSAVFAGDTVTFSSDTTHIPNLNEKLCIKNRYVDCGSTEINLNTSGNLGQSLNLISHSSATNHYAVLTFDSGSLKSAISGGRPNAGNWGTELRFYTHPSTTSDVHKTYERMRIRQDGEINLTYGRVNDAGHMIYRYGGMVAGTATVSVNIPVYNHGNIYWIEAFYTHHSLAYGGYLYGVYGAYSGHNGLQINNTIGSNTSGGTNVGTWSVSRGNAGNPVVVAKSAGTYSGQGHWWVHVHAGNTPNI